MNVTLKLPDHLCREARHRAVDESKSLSSWMAELVERELKGPGKVDKGSLIERLGDQFFTDRDIPLDDRKKDPSRKIQFP